MDVGCNPRIAERTTENGIKFAGEGGEAVGGNGGTVLKVAVSTPVEICEFDGSGGSANGVDSLRNDFFADAVSGDDGDAFG